MTGRRQISGTDSAEFHCWYAGDAGSALTKGRFILGKFSSYLRPGPVVDLGCGEGGLEGVLAQTRSVQRQPIANNLAASSATRAQIRTFYRQQWARSPR